MIETLEKTRVIIETAPTFRKGEEIAATSEVLQLGEGESEWIDFESDFTFPGEEDTAGAYGLSDKKSREMMMAKTVALAQKLSPPKKNSVFHPAEDDFLEDEEDFVIRVKDIDDFPRQSSLTKSGNEKNSEAMSGGSFFATIGLSLACLFVSFFMLGMPHFPGVLGFVFFELVAVLLLFAAKEFLRGWGYPERPFRMGLMGGFLSWEVLIVLFWSMLITALWKDQTLDVLGNLENSATLISFIGGVGAFIVSFYFLRVLEWARAAQFVVGKSGLFLISLAVAGAVSTLADLLLFL